MQRHWKRGLALILAALALSTSAFAGNVTVRSSGWRLSEKDAFLQNGTTYVALRAFSEAMGAEEVRWESGAATVTANGWTLTAVPGEQYLTVNGRCFFVPGGVRLKDDRVWVPVRAAAAAFGAQVNWTPGTVTVLPGSGSAVPGAEFYDGEDLYWLSRIISAESRGESLSGQIAVGNVVLNRVESSDFPDSVKEVVFDRRDGVTQFEPVSNGSIYDEPTERSVIAAKLALEGANTGGEALYFFAPALSAGSWIVKNRTYSHTIGCHRFYT